MWLSWPQLCKPQKHYFYNNEKHNTMMLSQLRILIKKIIIYISVIIIIKTFTYMCVIQQSSKAIIRVGLPHTHQGQSYTSTYVIFSGGMALSLHREKTTSCEMENPPADSVCTVALIICHKFLTDKQLVEIQLSLLIRHPPQHQLGLLYLTDYREGKYPLFKNNNKPC